MDLEIRPLTKEQRADLLSLTVKKEQRHFIEPMWQSLKEAEALPLWRTSGIYDGEKLIGFVMAGLFEEEGQSGRVWLDRFLIDQHYQGKGYGKAALDLVLRRLFLAYGRSEIYLSIHEDNQVAIHLYEQAGFRFNGETDNSGEKVMVYQRGETK